jgi:hypothetical protein
MSKRTSKSDKQLLGNYQLKIINKLKNIVNKIKVDEIYILVKLT